MKKYLGVCFVVTAISCLMSSTARADLIEWAVADGGNGHFYEVIMAPLGGINWIDAQADAEARGGYLATLTSEEESDFVFDNLVDDPAVWEFDTFAVGPWIGGFQPPGTAEPNADWQWVNGDGTLASTYENWRAGEPNNFSGEEDHILYFDSSNVQNLWNDADGIAGSAPSYVVEYSAVPEPFAGAPLAVLAVGYAFRRRRLS